jgi:hypothetical protein
VKRLIDRLTNYLAAVEKGDAAVRKYHDYNDVKKGLLDRAEFNRRWGGAVGSHKRLTPKERGARKSGGCL